MDDDTASCTFIRFLKLLRISAIVLQTFFKKYVAGFNECVVNFKDKSSNRAIVSVAYIYWFILVDKKKGRKKRKTDITN